MTCECGCGRTTAISNWTDKRTGSIKGEPRRFINGHQRRQHRPPIKLGILDGERVAYIPLTCGKWAIVDREKLPLLTGRWMYVDGYAKQQRGDIRISMHCLLLGIADSTEVQGDHQFGNTLDNRLSRLRKATPQQNAQNRKLLCTNTSGFRGVAYVAVRRKWCASIVVGGRRILIGYFDTKVRAARARDVAAIKYHGDFARLNFPLRKYA